MMYEMYEGWANYPTWAVENWLYEEPELRQELSRLINGAGDPSELADQIKDLVEKSIPKTGMCRDLLAWAINQVAWDQIASAYWAERYPPVW